MNHIHYLVSVLPGEGFDESDFETNLAALARTQAGAFRVRVSPYDGPLSRRLLDEQAARVPVSASESGNV